MQEKNTPSSKKDKENGLDLYGAVQVILSEKRTALSTLRTGIALLVLPMSAISFLVVTSRMYDLLHVGYLVAFLLGLAGLLVTLAGYLIVRSIAQMHHCDKMLSRLKRQHADLADFLD